jgi:hypothetical protein
MVWLNVGGGAQLAVGVGIMWVFAGHDTKKKCEASCWQQACVQTHLQTQPSNAVNHTRLRTPLRMYPSHTHCADALRIAALLLLSAEDECTPHDSGDVLQLLCSLWHVHWAQEHLEQAGPLWADHAGTVHRLFPGRGGAGLCEPGHSDCWRFCAARILRGELVANVDYRFWPLMAAGTTLSAA